ncbi:MAG: DUF3568 family protein [Phycisphaerales bacterium]
MALPTSSPARRSLVALVAGLSALLSTLVACDAPTRTVPDSPIAYAHIAGDFLTELRGECEPLATEIAAVLRRLDVGEVRARSDRDRGTVTGRLKNGERVSVRLRALRAGIVQAAIRWGTFGDETKSERLAREVSIPSVPSTSSAPSDPPAPAAPAR